MKTLKSVTLENGITIQLLENENNYKIVSSVGSIPETIAQLDKALSTFEKRTKLYSRFTRGIVTL